MSRLNSKIEAQGATKIEVRGSAQHGRGVFARETIAAGEAILVFTGPLLHRSQLDPTDYHLQIAEDFYLGASGTADDYVNHSCAPNSAFLKDLELVALRHIEPGEEITWDYSTAIDEEDFTGFDCGCRQGECRGRVLSYRHLDAATQARLQPHLLPYLRAKYRAK